MRERMSDFVVCEGELYDCRILLYGCEVETTEPSLVH